MPNTIQLDNFVTNRRRSDGNAKARFRARFKELLADQVKNGFSAEESFGKVWMQILEEIPLTEEEEGEMFEPLIRWAKVRLRS